MVCDHKEAITEKMRAGLSWELLYVNDLITMADSEEETCEKILQWKSGNPAVFVHHLSSS